MNNDTMPMGLAILIFAALGLLILATVVFAGFNAVQMIRGDRTETIVAAGKEFNPAEMKSEAGLPPEQPEAVAEAGTDADLTVALLDVYGDEIPAPTPPPVPAEKPMPTPEPTPEPTPTPTPRPAPPRPTPTPTPEPLPPVPCPTCHATTVATCQSCNGIGGGRGRPLVPGTPYDVREVGGQDDIWWCTACAGTGTVTCRTCDGAGHVIPPPITE